MPPPGSDIGWALVALRIGNFVEQRQQAKRGGGTARSPWRPRQDSNLRHTV
jgi:hypothetical protein